MKLEQIAEKAESFFEFPTENKDHVTTTSAVLFAYLCSKIRDELNENQFQMIRKLQNSLERIGNILSTVPALELDPEDESDLANSQVALFEISIIVAQAESV